MLKILLGHHHLDELFVVDLAVAINISFTDHFVDLFVGKFLAEISHNMTQFGSGDEAVSVLIEDLERLKNLFLAIGILHLTSHHRQEFREINSSTAISINLVTKRPRKNCEMMFPIYSKSIIFACFAMLTYLLDHVHELSLRWVLSERSHDGTKFLGGDGTYMVEEGDVSLEMKKAVSVE